MIEDIFRNFAQAGGVNYGEGAYSAETYQATGTQEVQETQGAQDVSAPSTGFVNSGPEVLVPAVLGVSIVVAVIIVAAKKSMRKGRSQ